MDFWGHRVFKMASLVPLKKKLVEVKLGELLSWIMMWDFAPLPSPQQHCKSLSVRA